MKLEFFIQWIVQNNILERSTCETIVFEGNSSSLCRKCRGSSTKNHFQCFSGSSHEQVFNAKETQVCKRSPELVSTYHYGRLHQYAVVEPVITVHDNTW